RTPVKHRLIAATHYAEKDPLSADGGSAPKNNRRQCRITHEFTRHQLRQIVELQINNVESPVTRK
ncbi:hypothetical protein HAX54_015158, partial [Datura stramonium]|nr:hypothetical protein [Datura stramonium]